MLAYGHRVRGSVLARLVGGGVGLLMFLSAFALGLQADPGAGSAVQALLELLALSCVAFAGWALPGAVKELAAGREVWYESGPVLRLSREGVEFRTHEGGVIAVFASWDLVDRCEFRPAPGGFPRWCIDAPIALTPSLSFAAAWAGMVPLNQIDARVAELARTWQLLGAPADRRLLRDVLVFGTPIVIDLARCPGVTVSQLDAAVRDWTFGRCGCDPTARPRSRPGPWGR